MIIHMKYHINRYVGTHNSLHTHQNDPIMSGRHLCSTLSPRSIEFVNKINWRDETDTHHQVIEKYRTGLSLLCMPRDTFDWLYCFEKQLRFVININVYSGLELSCTWYYKLWRPDRLPWSSYETVRQVPCPPKWVLSDRWMTCTA